ncbi:di-heme oxidoreductase family protein [Psychrobacter lutiphocae]|uniref:di-heme oxidoreductase family protein n=1 Tax=Psychrobacter lutiphocae TaxID=540500 RepID=UPI0003767104|nr:di-heme oxidoredictase family protein [Psychrobacter lutiphocae]
MTNDYRSTTQPVSSHKLSTKKTTKPATVSLITTMTAVSILGLTGLGLIGCQPAASDKDAHPETEQQANLEDNQRTQVIEDLAGVSINQLITFDPQEIKQGGDTGLSITSTESYSKPASNITASRKGDFFIGNAFFKQPWVVAPASTDSRDGLGALFNVAACQSCHIKDGRGHAPLDANDSADSLLIRLAMPATSDEQKAQLIGSNIEKVAHPVYGGQLQDRGIEGVPAEAKIEVSWQDVPMTFADGHVITLRRPSFKLANPGYGDFDPELMVSPRVAPPMIGLGLLEYIPEQAITSQAKIQNKNNGVKGKYNWVTDPETGKKSLGRFGWKAGQTRLLTQNMSAFNEDMGLTSRIRPIESCTKYQIECLNAPTGADDQGDGLPPVEVSNEVAAFVEFYTRNLAVPHRRNADDEVVLAGKKRFFDMGCQDCHTPRYQLPTGGDDGQLEQHGQIIYPYTDMLLHDMGDDLADRTIAGKLPSKDAQVEFLATSYDWRTPPLWGIGLAQSVDSQATFLHDGRARTLMEAVLWHGGEAQTHKQQVLKLDKKGREELEAFLNSL